MSKKKGKKKNRSPTAATVNLIRRELCNGYIDALTPEKVTNSGRSDGGWMDSTGVRNAGLGHIFGETPDPMDKYISNNAYARPAFATLQYELYPPLELCGNYCPEFQGDNKPSTRENLILFLKSTLNARENSYYKSGQYTIRDSPYIDHPKGVVDGGATTNADIIVTYFYERKCDAPHVDSDLPPDLTSKEQYAALYFSGKGVVIIQAANFERHDLPINIMDIVSSVRYVKESPYYGYERSPPSISLAMGVPSLHGGGMVPRSPTKGIPKICFQCGDTKAQVEVKRCSRCKVAVYCSGKCQKSDWKRHKNGECLPRDA